MSCYILGISRIIEFKYWPIRISTERELLPETMTESKLLTRTMVANKTQMSNAMPNKR